ncbi:MAG TPA: putative lipopolysaccharide heptosyltransferase III [Nitrospirota bacterium]
MNEVDISRIQNILVIKLRNIGDVLLATPAIRALKGAMPKARITALVRMGTEDMLTLNPGVAEVITFENGRGIAYELGLVRNLRRRKFDLVINMTEGDRGAVLAFISGAKIRVGIDPNGKGMLGKGHLFTHLVGQQKDRRHRAISDMDVLGPLGITDADPKVEIFTSAGDDAFIENLLAGNGVGTGQPVAVVHPTSRWLFKCWRDDAVASVIDYLEGRGFRVAVTAAPDERELEKARRIISMVTTRPMDFSGKLNLKQLTALFKRSALFFGVDTAPMHMAAAAGTPVVALFGPSDSETWGPFTDKRRVVLSTDEFPCIPCHKDGCNGSKRSACLESITVEEAVAAIEDLLEADK